MARTNNKYEGGDFIIIMIFIVIVAAIFLGVVYGTYSFLDNNKKNISENYATLLFLIIAIITIISVSAFFRQRNKLNKRIRGLESQKTNIEKELSRLKDILAQKDSLFESYKNLDLFSISTLYSDFLSLEYSFSEEWLNNEKIFIKHNSSYYSRIKGGRIARKSAEIVRELKKETKKYIKEYKIMLYKYEALLNLFPELKNYVDDIETIKELANFKNIDTLKEEYDKVIDYISKEDYSKLTVDERNQLALDNYIKGKKSKWQIGRDYEMYCSYIYEKDGWSVERFGIEKRLNDMGRDIIAIKNNTTHIIQCKYWSHDKLIHEKHIAQLYGSTIEYQISIENTLFDNNVIPVFITNIELTETAKKFAERLNVIVYKWQMQEFPRIKCNINNGRKIYHLPFDQQYDRTQIKNAGEFFAYNVNEAASKGFKRAKRHLFKKE